MEHACCQCRIGITFCKHIQKVLHASGAATGYDRDMKSGRQLVKGFVGKAILRAVVVHARKEYLPCPTVFRLVSPLEEFLFRPYPSSIQIAMSAVGIESCIYGTHTDLRTEPSGYLADKLRTAQRRTIHADLVCSCIK